MVQYTKQEKLDVVLVRECKRDAYETKIFTLRNSVILIEED